MGDPTGVNDQMMDGMMGLSWLWVILLCIALMLLLAVLIARNSDGPRSR